MYLFPTNQYISLQSQYPWHPNAKGLVEMEQRTCTMVRHGSTVRNGRRSNSSCINRWDQRVRERWDRLLPDRCPVYHSLHFAAVPLATSRSAYARGTWIRSCPWSRYGKLGKNVSQKCMAVVAAQIQWNNERHAEAAREDLNVICNQNCRILTSDHHTSFEFRFHHWACNALLVIFNYRYFWKNVQTAQISKR